jgi:hypothetical protein
LATLLKCVKMARSSFYYYAKQGSEDKYTEVKKRLSVFITTIKAGLVIGVSRCYFVKVD